MPNLGDVFYSDVTLFNIEPQNVGRIAESGKKRKLEHTFQDHRRWPGVDAAKKKGGGDFEGEERAIFSMLWITVDSTVLSVDGVEDKG